MNYNNWLIVLFGIIALLFTYNKISMKTVVLFLILGFILSLYSNNNDFEHLTSNEAVQNVASLYNTGTASLKDLTITGNLTVGNTVIKSSDSSISAGAITTTGNLNVGGTSTMGATTMGATTTGNLTVGGTTTANGAVTINNALNMGNNKINFGNSANSGLFWANGDKIYNDDWIHISPLTSKQLVIDDATTTWRNATGDDKYALIGNGAGPNGRGPKYL